MDAEFPTHDDYDPDARQLSPPKQSGPGGEPPEKSGGVTTIGVLNILFGLTCGCIGLAGAIMLLMIPQLMGGMTQGLQANYSQQTTRHESNAAAAEQLLADTQASEAATQQEIDDAQAGVADAKRRLDQHLKVNPIKMFDAMGKMFESGGMMTYNFANIGGTFIINLLWVISGIGLLSRKSWARSVAISNSGLKLGFEMILGVVAVVVMPSIMAEFTQTMQEMLSSLPGNTPQAAQMQQFGAQMKMQMTMQTIIGALMGSVYPVIVLVVMMQRRTKQEFLDWSNYYLRGGK